MRVDQILPPESVQKTGAGRESAPTHSFAASLSRVSGPATVRRAEATAARAAESAGKAAAEAARFEIPKNERYEPVPGKAYEEIVAGPRNGMFINRSGNSRDGDAFVLVKRGGRVFHIYGTGDKREVVPVRREAAEPKVAERVADVAGRAFDKIVEGRREGMYVNRSGNSRDGQAFRIVERGEHELHVYGSGRNRLVVSIVAPEHRKEREADEVKATRPKTETPAATPVPVAGGQV